jgi:hypothetical protein
MLPIYAGDSFALGLLPHKGLAQHLSIMISSILKKGAIGLAAAGALTMLLSTTPSATVGGIKAGDSVSYSWRTPLVNGMGRQSLEDFLGTPVLIEFWGTK